MTCFCSSRLSWQRMVWTQSPCLPTVPSLIRKNSLLIHFPSRKSKWKGPCISSVCREQGFRVWVIDCIPKPLCLCPQPLLQTLQSSSQGSPTWFSEQTDHDMSLMLFHLSEEPGHWVGLEDVEVNEWGSYHVWKMMLPEHCLILNILFMSLPKQQNDHIVIDRM